MTDQEHTSPRRTIGGDLFEVDGERVNLKLSRCNSCSSVWFPARQQCATCASTDLVLVLSGTSGTVYASSVVRIGPAQFGPPYGVAYVDVDGARVLAHTGSAEPLPPGAPVRLVAAPIAHDDRGALWSYAVRTTEGVNQ